MARETVFTYVADLPIELDDMAITKLLDAGEAVFVDAGAVIKSKGTTSNDQPFTLVGVVKGKPDERWAELVYAPDEAEAEKRVQDQAPKGVEYSVAAVMPGVIQAALPDDNVTPPSPPMAALVDATADSADGAAA